MMEDRQTLSVKPDKIRLLNLLEYIAEGRINVPEFQRDFVWKKDQMKNLFDSISKGYPIGSLLFWEPEKTYRTFRKVGPYEIDSPKKNYYVLDGYQRIYTLFGVLSNPNNYGKSELEVKEFLIYYNLYTKDFDFIKGKRNSYFQIPLYKIIDTFEYLDFIQEIKSLNIDKEEQNYLINNAKEINKIFLDYHIPYVEINGGDIKSAVDIFSRINSTGTEISEDFMLSALSYDDVTGFLLSESISEFLVSLSDYNFDSMKRDTILNCISNAMGKIYFDVKIEDLLIPNLEQFSNDCYVHIRKAVNFLYARLNVIDVKLLPYPTQLIFISEFFRLNPEPSAQHLYLLEDWFWITTYSNYFTIYSLSQQRNAYNLFCDFAVGHHPTGIYKPENDYVFVCAKFPEKLNFTGVRTKALQLFYLRSISTIIFNYKDSIKESFISLKHERNPANIILRFGSEYNTSPNKQFEEFLLNSSELELRRHFMYSEMVENIISGDMDRVIEERTRIMKDNEKDFLSFYNIKYTEQ